jgi:hypothetical protein
VDCCDGGGDLRVGRLAGAQGRFDVAHINLARSRTGGYSRTINHYHKYRDLTH